MDENKKILEEIKNLKENIIKNQKILKKIQSHNRWSMFVRIIYWIILLGAAYGTWVLLKPVWDTIKLGIDQVANTGDSLKDIISTIKSSLDSLIP